MTLALRVIVEGGLTEEGGAFRLGIHRRVHEGIGKAAEELTKMVQRTLKTQSNRYGENPSAPGTPPNRGRNKLSGSIKWKYTGDWKAIVGTELIYGRIQELGGTITSAKPMTVPVSREARKHLMSGGTTRTFPKTLFMWKTARGKTTYLAEAKTQQAFGKQYNKITVHFMLTYAVTLPPRPFLRPTADSAEFQGKLRRIFGDLFYRVTKDKP